MSIREILDAHPSKDTFDMLELTQALERLSSCVVTCRSCADACLHEDDIAPLRDCIQTDLNCSDVCAATLCILSRPGPDGETWKTMLQACVAACEACADECQQHDHDHCQVCARECRACAEACSALLAVAR